MGRGERRVRGGSVEAEKRIFWEKKTPIPRQRDIFTPRDRYTNMQRPGDPS